MVGFMNERKKSTPLIPSKKKKSTPLITTQK